MQPESSSAGAYRGTESNPELHVQTQLRAVSETALVVDKHAPKLNAQTANGKLRP